MHSKVKNLDYDKLDTQDYIKSELFSNEHVELLFALRSKMVNVKANFSSKYRDMNCLYGCKTIKDHKRP